MEYSPVSVQNLYLNCLQEQHICDDVLHSAFQASQNSKLSENPEFELQRGKSMNLG